MIIKNNSSLSVSIYNNTPSLSVMAPTLYSKQISPTASIATNESGEIQYISMDGGRRSGRTTHMQTSTKYGSQLGINIGPNSHKANDDKIYFGGEQAINNIINALNKLKYEIKIREEALFNEDISEITKNLKIVVKNENK